MALNLPDLVARLRVDDSDLDKTRDKVNRFGKDLDSTADRSSGKVGGLSGAIGGLGKAVPLAGAAVAGLAVGALAVGGAFVETSSRLELLGQKSKTVFAEALPTVQAWADSSAAAMKLTRSEAVGLATNMGDLLVPMGFTRDQAAKMSTETVGLAGALSKWSGGTVSAADAANVLTDAMLGETDGLKALGISISAAEIASVLAAKGQDKLTGSALAQAEAVATQELIFSKSTDAQAAYAAGGETLASRLEGLKVKGRELWETLVERLTPAAERFADWAINEGVAALQRLGEWIVANKENFRQLGVSALQGAADMLRGFASMVEGAGAAFHGILRGAATVAEALGLPIADQLRNAEQGFLRTRDTAVVALNTAADAADAAAGKLQNLGRSHAAPNVSVPGATASIAALDHATGRAQHLGQQRPTVHVGANTAQAERDLQGLITRIGKANSTLTVNVRQQGDGPGAPPAGGGPALKRVMPVLQRLGGYVTSTYRTPSRNKAVGGSPNSYHIDQNNPAVDIGGPTSVLDKVAAALRSMGGWREGPIWRSAGHYDHVHVADQGGVFQGPGYVYMGAGRERFAAGGLEPARKVGPLPARTADRPVSDARNDAAVLAALEAQLAALHGLTTEVRRQTERHLLFTRQTGVRVRG